MKENDFNNMFDHFQRDFISTNSNNLKFNYKTNMLLSEMKDKLSSYDKSIGEQTDTLNNIKSFKKHKHFLDKPISPRALKVCMDNGRQVYMGFCKLDLIAGDKY